MRQINIFSLGILLFCVGCSNNDHSDVTVYNVEPINNLPITEIKTHNIDFGDTVIINPESIWVEDTLLIMFTSDKQNFLRVYSLVNNELIAKYGFIGRGPGEFLYPQIFKNAPGEYLITDRLRYEIIDINRLIVDKEYKPESYSVDEGLKAIDFFATNGSREDLIYCSGSCDDQLCFQNLKNNKIKPFNCFPDIKGVNISNFIAHTNVFKSSMTKRGDSLFIAYYYYPIIDIVSLKTKKVSRIQHPVDYRYNSVKIIDDINAVVNDPFLCNMSSYTTGTYIYTLYYGDEMKNVENMSCLPQILKYNYDGELVSRFKIDCIATKFCVSDDDKNIYLLSYDEEFNPSIVKAEI